MTPSKLLQLVLLIAAPASQATQATQATEATETCKADPVLQAKAKVSCADARKAALAKIGSGSVKDAELEEEHGRLVYSIDIKKPKSSGIEEVQIDALTGEVVSVVHEDAKAEAAERAADKKESQRAK